MATRCGIGWVRHGGRTLRFAAIVFWSVTVGWAAKAPDWLTTVIADDVSELSRGRSAVRLLDSSDVRYLPDNRVKRLSRGAVRVLLEQGRQLALCTYRFNAANERVLSARAWLISGDGKKVDAYTMREFSDTALRVGNRMWDQQRVFSYSAVERIGLGGVFAWEFEVESESSIVDVNWTFPTGWATHISMLEVTPGAGGKLVWSATNDEGVPPPVAGAQPGGLRWERRDFFTVTGQAADQPTGFLATARGFSVRHVVPDNRASIESWPDLARLAAGVIAPCLVAPPEVKAKAEAIVAGKTGRWERVRALTEFVQKEISYLHVNLDKDYLAGYRPHAAGEVLKNRFGDCKDKASLLVAMLRAVGEDGQVVLVAAGDPKAVRPEWPSARFNHAIAAIPADDAPAGWPIVDAGPLGRLVLFDATDSHTPLGVLSGGDQGGYGLIASAQAAGLLKLPIASPEVNAAETHVEAKLDATGVLTASVEEISSGAIGVVRHAARENLRNERFTPVLEKRLRENVSFLEDLHWKDTWDAADARWRLEFDFKAPRYARRTAGSLMLVAPCVISYKSSLNPWRTRQEGVVWLPASTQRKRVRLTLPEGATVEEMPQGNTGRATLVSTLVSTKLTYRRDGNDVIAEYELVQKGGFVDQRDYEILRGVLQRLDEAERRPLLIRLDPAAANTAGTR